MSYHGLWEDFWAGSPTQVGTEAIAAAAKAEAARRQAQVEQVAREEVQVQAQEMEPSIRARAAAAAEEGARAETWTYWAGIGGLVAGGILVYLVMKYWSK
jgi:hypothetical protein